MWMVTLSFCTWGLFSQDFINLTWLWIAVTRNIWLKIIIWGANHPCSQLRAELRRTRLKRVREAGMQGRIQLPATSTHYDHGAQPRSKVFDFFLREENRIVWKPSWHSREPTHNSTHIWPDRESNRGSPWWEASALHTSQPCHLKIV